MRLISLGSRVVATLAAAGLAATLALVSGATAAPSAPIWGKLGATDKGIVWSVDQTSLRRQGDYVLSTVKVAYPHAVASGINGKWMDYQLRERADDCKAGKAAILARTDYSRSDERVAQGPRFTVASAQFSPIGSDPLEKATAEYVCSHAPYATVADGADTPPPPVRFETTKREDRGPPVAVPDKGVAPHAPSPPPVAAPPKAGLVAAVDLKGKSESDWTFLSRSEKGDLNVAVLDGSTETIGHAVSVVTRSDYAADEKMADGTHYRRDVSRILIDCEERRFGYLSSDYYDAQGRLVGVEKAVDAKASDKIPAGSLVERLANLVCRRSSDNGGGGGSAEMSVFTGTGWLASKGYIVTASHVVGGAKSVTIFRDGKRLGEADVVRDDPSNDVAILKPRFDTSKFTALRLKTGPAVLGSRVFTLGYPLADELGYQTVKMAAGDVSSLTGVDYASHRIDDPRFLQISIPVQGGNSGGPVIDEDGEVIAIISSKKERTADSELTQNVNFALKSSYVARLLVDLPVAGRYKLSSARGKISTIVADVQSGVFLVWVERPSSSE